MNVPTIIYIEEDQRDLMRELYPQKMSRLVREFLNVLLMEKSLNESELSPEMMARLLMHREQQIVKQKMILEREKLKSSLYDYLNNKNIPIIFARKGKRAAKKAAKEMIIGFRESGFNLPDYLVSDFLTEYLEIIEYSGIVDQAWSDYRSIKVRP